ncbi:MAG: undecaprenyl-diphosphate phosphatase [Muribaculaceae bacterium]
MDWLQALILGLVQGLTEFLPVSSSGHLAIISNLFGIDGESSLTFTIVVHVATVFSTLLVLWHEVDWILKGLFKFKLNDETRYFAKIVVSMIPVGIVGLFFKDYVEEVFGTGLLVVGVMLLVTSALLAFAYYYKPRVRREIGIIDAFVIGLAQAVAVLPGLSRSGSTIATGLLIGNKKENLAQFSFLMVIPPILGEMLLDGKKIIEGASASGAEVSVVALAVGFIAAFVSGALACKWMISVVRRGKLVYFAIYCAVVGLIAISCNLFN